MADSVGPLRLPLRQHSDKPPRVASLLQATVALVASVCGVSTAVLLFAGGAEFGRVTPHTSAAVPASLTSLNRSLSPGDLAAGLTADCYTYTGGTCVFEGCHASRNSVCESGMCMCIGGCAGVDGVCYHQTYPTTAEGFTLTNKKFNWQKMYMPATGPLGQVKTTAAPSFVNFGKDKWILHELPGNVSGHKDYFLSTQRYPDYVAAIRSTTGTAFSAFGVYEEGLGEEDSPDKLAVRVCTNGGGEIMIGSVGKITTEWFYLHHLSWCVYGWGLGNPGDGGVWISHPPIPDDALPACHVTA